MKTFYFGFFGVFALTYLAYMTWLTGYKAGYDDGAAKAWENANRVMMPHQVPDSTELTTATATAGIIPVSQPSAGENSR